MEGFAEEIQTIYIFWIENLGKFVMGKVYVFTQLALSGIQVLHGIHLTIEDVTISILDP